jgi:hypothetical protein
MEQSTAASKKGIVTTFDVTIKAQEFLQTARDILVRRIEERSSARFHPDGAALKITLMVEGESDTDDFTIEETDSNTVTISGATPAGLLAGIGKFLRTSRYGAEGIVPSSWRGSSNPACDMRGMYFATHFLNWYHVAPEAEIERYIEDLALWGVNNVGIAFPIIHLRGWDDPDTTVFFERYSMYARICQRLGLRSGILCCANQDFVAPRSEFKGAPNREGDRIRKGDHGNNVCPSIPGATEYLLGIMDEFILRLKQTPPDFVCFWPYDEGGCGCDACHPWGANGFYNLCKSIAAKLEAELPKHDIVLSTWMYDTPESGEWQGLSDRFDEGDDWIDHILADSHEDFPRYPLESGVPGDVSLITFPEISMWGLSPWGGFGANPLPQRFQRLWDQVKHIAHGGLPYSEGIFEDINKAVVTQCYWNRDGSSNETLREYATYEFGGADVDTVLNLMRGIETNHITVPAGCTPDIALAKDMVALAEQIDGTLTKYAQTSWRWRILYLRALLDVERYEAGIAAGWTQHQNWSELLADNQAAQTYMREISDLFHCTDDADERHPQHSAVRPPLAVK